MEFSRTASWVAALTLAEMEDPTVEATLDDWNDLDLEFKNLEVGYHCCYCYIKAHGDNGYL